MNRRTFLQLGTALGAVMLARGAGSALADPSGPADRFDWDLLVARMKARAGVALDDDVTVPKVFAQLGYDDYRLAQFRRERALWRGEQRNFQLQPFLPSRLFNKPVELFEIVDGEARPMSFVTADFEFLAPLDPADFADIRMPGVAGFRLLYPLNRSDAPDDELIAFLGASYFRALGRGTVYGLSARGLAIDTASGDREEFPRFTRFYIERPQPGARAIRVWAELESERVTGAYAFTIEPGAETQIDVTAAIFLRGDVSRLGLAPLTSMYLFGENDRGGFDDFRAEVHDSDGLAILRADGERVWRPLSNPATLQLSAFGETNPRGFGLLQRDRSVDNYLDAEADYERRPSCWIEPVGDWGSGAVLLAEIPSDKEAHDNVVAFWMPDGGLEAGAEHWLRYRMIWASEVEGDIAVARAVRTRTGAGGMAGVEADADLRKFVIDFAGPPLAGLGADAPVEAQTAVGNADVAHRHLGKLDGSDTWRLTLDVRRPDGSRPVELRAALHLDGKPLSETWTYQWGKE